jgi:hypothetical protein
MEGRSTQARSSHYEDGTYNDRSENPFVWVRVECSYLDRRTPRRESRARSLLPLTRSPIIAMVENLLLKTHN